MRPVHTGPVRRELCKLAGSSDASHRTHPERPVLTRLMRREGRQTARTPDAEHWTHSSASGALCTPAPQTDTTSDALDQRPVLPTPASGECFSPRLLQNFHRRNRKYTLNFLKSAKSRLASSVGGREEPTPLSTLGTPPPLQSVPTPPSVHHHVQVC